MSKPKKSLRVLLAAASAVFATAALAGEITLFHARDFVGESLTLNGAAPDLLATGFNDSAASVVVHDGVWEACTDIRFQGRCMQLRPGEYRGVDEEGFFHSADLVSTDDCGRLYFHGRLDRLFKTGGKLVNAAEIEQVLARFPGVHDVRCRVKPHAMLGLVPVVDIVAEAGHALIESTLRQHCEKHLEAHAVPRQIVFVGALPMSHSGKTDRS